MSRYQISELAGRAGVPATTLRFYERSGLLPAARAANGYRRYGDDALERLALIGAGQQLGLPLAQIRDLLTARDTGQCADVRERLRPLLAARVAQARERTATLADSITRLEQALAATAPEPPPGPCAPSCGCLTEPHPAPLACTLTGSDQEVRRSQWRDLLGRASARASIPGGIEFTLPAALAGTAAELAAAEQRCCPFFRFTLVFGGGDVQLSIQAPPAASPFLHRITDDPAAPAPS